MLQVRNFETHAIIELASIHHLLHLIGKLHQLGVLLIPANVVEQVIEDITDHPDLLLVLCFIVLDSDTLIASHSCIALLFLSLQIKCDV